MSENSEVVEKDKETPVPEKSEPLPPTTSELAEMKKKLEKALDGRVDPSEFKRLTSDVEVMKLTLAQKAKDLDLDLAGWPKSWSK